MENSMLIYGNPFDSEQMFYQYSANMPNQYELIAIQHEHNMDMALIIDNSSFMPTMLPDNLILNAKPVV